MAGQWFAIVEQAEAGLYRNVGFEPGVTSPTATNGGTVPDATPRRLDLLAEAFSARGVRTG